MRRVLPHQTASSTATPLPDNVYVLVTPAPASYTVYHGCGVFCSAQASGTLTFSAVNKPDIALSVQILLIS